MRQFVACVKCQQIVANVHTLLLLVKMGLNKNKFCFEIFLRNCLHTINFMRCGFRSDFYQSKIMRLQVLKIFRKGVINKMRSHAF